MKLWRICRERHRESAFSGEGARLASGRWNSAGVPIAYASECLSLAAMELFVHLDLEERPRDLVSVLAEAPVDQRDIERQKSALLRKLSRDWRYRLAETQEIGDAWAREGASLVLMVPSVIIEEEWNMLLNPAHEHVSRLKIVEMKPFRFDERMFKAAR